MKRLLLLLLGLLFITAPCLQAQDDNPYARFGHKGKVLKTPQERQQFMLKIPNPDATSEIALVGIAPNEGKYYLFDAANEVIQEDTLMGDELSRFLSVDPLTRSYPWYTPYQFAGNKPIMAVDLDGLEEKIAIIIESETEFSSVHERALKDAGYVIFNVNNGGQALRTIKDSQIATQEPTRELLFLTHGFEGGAAGNETNSGIYSDAFLSVNEESGYIADGSFDPTDSGNDVGLTNGFASPERVVDAVSPDGMVTDYLFLQSYSTIEDFKKMVESGAITFTNDATITFGGCNISNSCEVQEAFLNLDPNELTKRTNIYSILLKSDPNLAEKYRKINFGQELSDALGVNVIAASPRIESNSNGASIYDGATGPVNSTTRTAARWFKYTSNGEEKKVVQYNDYEIIKK